MSGAASGIDTASVTERAISGTSHSAASTVLCQ